jgi:hypothetical protein
VSYAPGFDIDMARGRQGELFIRDIVRMLAEGNGSIEIKTDSWFVHSRRVYVELECRGRDGTWRPSGLATTRARLWTLKLGRHPACCSIATEWLRTAAELAGQDPSNTASCNSGSNVSRGVFVTIDHLIATRDRALDEH